MVQTSVILEQLKQLTLAERLAIVEAMLQSIRQELFPQSATPAPKSLAEAAQLLLADYTTDAELVAFTALDGDDFYVEGQPSSTNGLSKLSAADTFQVCSVAQQRFVKQLG